MKRFWLISLLLIIGITPIRAQTVTLSEDDPILIFTVTGADAGPHSLDITVPDDSDAMVVMSVLEDDAEDGVLNKGFDITIDDVRYDSCTSVTPCSRLVTFEEDGTIWFTYNGSREQQAIIGFSLMLTPPDYAALPTESIDADATQTIIAVHGTEVTFAIAPELIEDDEGGYLVVCVFNDDRTRINQKGIELRLDDADGPLDVDIDLGSWRTPQCDNFQISVPTELTANHRDNNGNAALMLVYFSLDPAQEGE